MRKTAYNPHNEFHENHLELAVAKLLTGANWILILF
jgi:hypothetical protein